MPPGCAAWQGRLRCRELPEEAQVVWPPRRASSRLRALCAPLSGGRKSRRCRPKLPGWAPVQRQGRAGVPVAWAGGSTSGPITPHSTAPRLGEEACSAGDRPAGESPPPHRAASPRGFRTFAREDRRQRCPACRCGAARFGDSPPHRVQRSGRASIFTSPRMPIFQHQTARCSAPARSKGGAHSTSCSSLAGGWQAPANGSRAPRNIRGWWFCRPEPVTRQHGDGQMLPPPRGRPAAVGTRVSSRPKASSPCALLELAPAPPGGLGPTVRCASTRKVWPSKDPPPGEQSNGRRQAAAVVPETGPSSLELGRPRPDRAPQRLSSST